MLAIALVPSAALLVAGVGASAYTVQQGLQAREWSTDLRGAAGPAIEFIAQATEERRLTLLRIAGDTKDSANLAQVRPRVDASMAQLAALGTSLAKLNPTGASGSDALRLAGARIPAIRAAIDAGAVSSQDAFAFYNQLIETNGQGLQRIMRTAQDPATAIELPTAVDLFNVENAMSRSNALAAGATAAGGLTAAQLRAYRDDVIAYHTQLGLLVPRLTPHGQAQYRDLMGSLAWRRLQAVENALIDRGPKPASGRDDRALPTTVSQWQDAAREVGTTLVNVLADHFSLAMQGAAERGRRTFVRSLLAGIGVLLVAGIAFLVAFRLSAGLIGRLTRLRMDTLQLADERLPRIVEHLRTGKPIDMAAEVPRLDYGVDEIGQVADAFNKAQQTAIWAAEREAHAREGMNTVFLNIAHRSQMVAHRQLEVLDEAERKQEDPTHLELLFRIDHLATRARRNAENLVILGGERPGRKWRNPVPLDEIARGAIAETENFARVTTGRLPDVLVEGAMVADLVHLLAELVDNGTSFSPPGTRVEVRGNLVGRGVVVEVEDQGLGMTVGQRDQLNALLHEPPDFQIVALSRQTRLGLFVVAQLATRHGVLVTLADSAYGGTRAIVLIPSARLTIKPDAVRRTEPSGPSDPGALSGQRRQLYAPTHHLSRAAALLAGNGNPGFPQRQRQQSEPAPHPDAAPQPPAPPEPVRPVHAAGPNGTPAAAHRHGNGKRAPLPRRRRQASLAPQLAAEVAPPTADLAPEPAGTAVGAARSPEQARETMAAMLRGTRQGRDVPPADEAETAVPEDEGGRGPHG